VKYALLGFIGAASLLAALPAASHHSFAAEFDINRPLKLTGTVSKLEWTNPHAWIFVDAKNESGAVQTWAVELVGINDLLRRGWGRDRVKREERHQYAQRSVGHDGKHGRAPLGDHPEGWTITCRKQPDG
jgi:hypothetical protein